MNNTLTYTKNGDYLIPDLKLSEQQSKPLGKYGRMRKAYLKEHRPVSYTHLDVYKRQGKGCRICTAQTQVKERSWK